jgi:D-alanyl-D-alanine carboxypeptidase
MNFRMTVSIAGALLLQAGCSVPPPVDDHGPRFREVTDSRFEPFLQDMATKQHFTGGVLVMRDGKVLHAKAYGPATGSRPNTVDTRFHVGSITKEFTAAAIMQLVEKGMLRLDGPINGYLPQRYRSAKWDTITVHHLLPHTSGIPDYAVTRDYYHVVKGFCPPDTVDGMVREAMSEELEFAPGTKYSYTNLGYTLLGVIIENQTHTSFADYIKRNVLEPMGMSASSMEVVGRVPNAAEAQGFRWDAQRGMHVPDDVVTLPATSPDGGLITTLGDFSQWARIFTAGEQQILSQDSLRLMSTPHIHIGNGGPLDEMGYGLFVGDRLIGHGGLVVGFSSQFVYDRETRSLITVFSNDFDGNPQQVTFGLLTLLLTGHS